MRYILCIYYGSTIGNKHTKLNKKWKVLQKIGKERQIISNYRWLWSISGIFVNKFQIFGFIQSEKLYITLYFIRLDVSEWKMFIIFIIRSRPSNIKRKEYLN